MTLRKPQQLKHDPYIGMVNGHSKENLTPPPDSPIAISGRIGRPALSIVIPCFNEETTILPLYTAIRKICVGGEIIFVDDGSTDATPIELTKLAKYAPDVQVITLRRNMGKSAALAAGFKAAQGELILTMDADLQDDPQEIPKFLQYIDNADVVAGVRVNRDKNDPLSKTIPSQFYNFIVARLTGIPLSDFNCGFKLYRREVIEAIPMYGEFHRYIPVLAHWKGFTRIVGLPIMHRPRRAGVSKFGKWRLMKGALDFLTILFLTKFIDSPMHMFGGAGLFLWGAGVGICAYLAGLWLAGQFNLLVVDPIGPRPLLAVGLMLWLFGSQLLAIGLLGEYIRYFRDK